MKHTILVLLVLILLKTEDLKAQNFDRDHKYFRVEGGIGPGTADMMSADVNLSCRLKEDKIISLRYITGEQSLGKYFLFSNIHPHEKVWDIGLLFGKATKGRIVQVSAAGGIGLVGGLKRGKFISTHPGWFGGWREYERVNFLTVGIPVEIEAMVTPSHFFGFGISLYADLNPTYPFAGAHFRLMLGDIRKPGPKKHKNDSPAQIAEPISERKNLVTITPVSLLTKIQLRYERVITKRVSAGATLDASYFREYSNYWFFNGYPTKKLKGASIFLRWYFDKFSPEGFYLQTSILTGQYRKYASYETDEGRPRDVWGTISTHYETRFAQFAWTYGASLEVGYQILVIKNRIPVDVSIGFRKIRQPEVTFDPELEHNDWTWTLMEDQKDTYSNKITSSTFPVFASFNVGFRF